MKAIKGRSASLTEQSSSNYFSEIAESGDQNPLTCIHPRIHCTTAEGQGELSEQEKIIVEVLLDTLSEVALAVASRRLKHMGEGEATG